MSRNPWQSARNILCVRLDYLGDVLMCTPAIRALKTTTIESSDAQDGKLAVANSGRRITLLTSASGAAAARFVPEIDDTLVYAAPWLKSSAPHVAHEDLAIIEMLCAQRFDAAVIFTSYSQSALPAAMLCYLAGIPLRLAHCRENPYQMLSDWVPDPEPHQRVRHEVRRQLDLVATVGSIIGGTSDSATSNATDSAIDSAINDPLSSRAINERLSFTVPDTDLVWARQHVVDLGIAPEQPYLLLHPGATAASRRYPIHHWIEVLRLLSDDLGYALIVTGSADEAELIAAIAGSPHPLIHPEPGTLELGQLAALIAHAAVVISNNTGPAHIAAALGTPLVDLYALTNPQHTPWQVESRVLFHDVPCRNCYKSVCPQGHHDCLEKVPPHAVVEAVQELLGKAQCFPVATAANRPSADVGGTGLVARIASAKTPGTLEIARAAIAGDGRFPEHGNSSVTRMPYRMSGALKLR